jgi:hypothetical protein
MLYLHFMAQLDVKFLTFYGTDMYFVVLKKALH